MRPFFLPKFLTQPKNPVKNFRLIISSVTFIGLLGAIILKNKKSALCFFIGPFYITDTLDVTH